MPVLLPADWLGQHNTTQHYSPNNHNPSSTESVCQSHQWLHSPQPIASGNSPLVGTCSRTCYSCQQTKSLGLFPPQPSFSGLFSRLLQAKNRPGVHSATAVYKHFLGDVTNLVALKMSTFTIVVPELQMHLCLTAHISTQKSDPANLIIPSGTLRFQHPTRLGCTYQPIRRVILFPAAHICKKAPCGHTNFKTSEYLNAQPCGTSMTFG